MDVPSDYIPYQKKAFDGLDTGLAGFLQASAPDWIIYDFASHWLPPIATKLGISRAFILIINAWFAAFFGLASALIDGSGATNNASGVSDLYRFGSVVLGCDVCAIRHYKEFEPQWLTLLQDLQPKQQW